MQLLVCGAAASVLLRLACSRAAEQQKGARKKEARGATAEASAAVATGERSDPG